MSTRSPRPSGVPCRGPGVLSVKVAGTAAGGGETEASSRPGTVAGPDIEPDAQPARWGHRRVKRRVYVPADAARANPAARSCSSTTFTPSPAGLVAGA